MRRVWCHPVLCPHVMAAVTVIAESFNAFPHDPDLWSIIKIGEPEEMLPLLVPFLRLSAVQLTDSTQDNFRMPLEVGEILPSCLTSSSVFRAYFWQLRRSLFGDEIHSSFSRIPLRNHVGRAPITTISSGHSFIMSEHERSNRGAVHIAFQHTPPTPLASHKRLSRSNPSAGGGTCNS